MHQAVAQQILGKSVLKTPTVPEFRARAPPTYVSCSLLAGKQLVRYMELTENGSLIANMPSSGEVTFGMQTYTVTGSFPLRSNCAYLWEYICSTDYLEMGNVSKIAPS
jgi:hypothetical protein